MKRFWLFVCICQNRDVNKVPGQNKIKIYKNKFTSRSQCMWHFCIKYLVIYIVDIIIIIMNSDFTSQAKIMFEYNLVLNNLKSWTIFCTVLNNIDLRGLLTVLLMANLAVIFPLNSWPSYYLSNCKYCQNVSHLKIQNKERKSVTISLFCI